MSWTIRDDDDVWGDAPNVPDVPWERLRSFFVGFTVGAFVASLLTLAVRS